MTTRRDTLEGDSLADDRRVPISEARAQLSSLIKRAEDHDIILINHGRPAAVLMSPENYRALLDELDELQDRLAVQDNADAPAVPFGHLLAELDLTDVQPQPMGANVASYLGAAGGNVHGVVHGRKRGGKTESSD